MIKVGARGYSSGRIVTDANLEDNLKAAKKGGTGYWRVLLLSGTE